MRQPETSSQKLEVCEKSLKRVVSLPSLLILASAGSTALPMPSFLRIRGFFEEHRQDKVSLCRRREVHFRRAFATTFSEQGTSDYFPLKGFVSP